MSFSPLPLLLALVLDPALAAEPDPEVQEAVRVLEQARIGTDGAALLAYLRTQTPSPEDQKRLAAAVARLGDDAFAIREQATRQLVTEGRPAVSFLRTALRDPDLEVVYRAQACLERINAPTLTPPLTAAVRLLAARRPAGSAAALLAFLPFAADEEIEDAVFATLLVVGRDGGKPQEAVLAAASDALPSRRAAVAHVLGRCERSSARATLLQLRKDADPLVRYEASVGLLRQGDRTASTELIALLTEAPPPLSYRVEDTLWALAGDKAPAGLSNVTLEDRRRGREAWSAWWKEQGDRVDLALLDEPTPFLGRTLVCEYDGLDGGGRLAEYDREGKLLWQINGLVGINDAQLLPGGRVLVAERNAGRVTERDRSGKILWTCDAPGAIACQRLPGGNTLVATFNELFEVNAQNQRIHSLAGNFRHAIRLRSGHILAVDASGRITELDATWNTVRLIVPSNYGQGAGYWASVELLPSGRLLVAYGGSGKVVELDTSGKVVWECTQPNCVFATRLRNGNTLISRFEQRNLVEVDRDGAEKATLQLRGRPFTVRRY